MNKGIDTNRVLGMFFGSKPMNTYFSYLVFIIPFSTQMLSF